MAFFRAFTCRFGSAAGFAAASPVAGSVAVPDTTFGFFAPPSAAVLWGGGAGFPGFAGGFAAAAGGAAATPVGPVGPGRARAGPPEADIARTPVSVSAMLDRKWGGFEKFGKASRGQG